LLLGPLPALGAADQATNTRPVSVRSVVRYTTFAPVDQEWTGKKFDDSKWTLAKDPAEITAAVPQGGEVWVRIRRELPWELINNTYARILRTGPAEIYVNGKQKSISDRTPMAGWQSVALTPGREETPGWNVYAFHGKCNGKDMPAVGFDVIHEPWVEREIPDVKPQPLIEEKLRDANVILGGDGNYYLCGTFAGTYGDGPLFFDYHSGKYWKNNDGVKLYRSADLRNWTDMGWVWTFKGNATWCREPFKSDDPMKNGKQGIFAPKFHYLDGKYYIVYGVNWSSPTHRGDVGIAVADKPEGPYRETSPDKAVCSGIDAQIFRDDDGQCYMVHGRGYIAKLKPDLSGLAEPDRLMACANYPMVGHEGAGVIKRGDTYYLMCAEIVSKKGGGSYGCTMVASSKHVLGPYGNRSMMLPYAGGHTRPFQDKNGKWWTALWTWSGNLSHRFSIIGLDFDPDGTIRPTGEIIRK